ncbi:MAG TPA: TAXI family TRAP transporter solute-binding subunit [Verrucomicrobiae bacterium]|nr:TAXI family TRAP transporter solute-binding subunit [Verrucomicrobiae bacterium]
MSETPKSNAKPAPVPPAGPASPVTMVSEIFGVNRAIAIAVVSATVILLIAAVCYVVRSSPPTTIVITSGPEGSLFQTNALKYVGLLARHGVKVQVLPSEGAMENLQRLSDPSSRVDVGFVLGGMTNGASRNLVSLGSISHQPLLIFYRGTPVEILSQFAGKQLAVGPVGSGTRALALTLLQANGITTKGPTTFLDWEAGPAAQALLDGRIDAVFLMGEAASPMVLRELLRAPGIQLYSFTQATAYTRRFTYLNEVTLPQGGIDFGSNLPPRDVTLIGPNVELIARDTLHPALSDLLLEAAREIHGRATILQQKGEFPAPIESDFRISDDAARFYKSGRKFFYRYLPFWLASLTSRILVAFVPMLVIAVPIVRSIPSFYRWRIRTQIYRWYRALLALEKRLLTETNPERHAQLLQRLEHIENAVNKMKVPAYFGDQFYGLRGHIDYVRGIADRYVTEKKSGS